MPASLTSVADPNVSTTVEHVGYPQPALVQDVSIRMWDGHTKPEVSYGSTEYTRWTWTPIWPTTKRPDAEALLSFFAALRTMGDRRFVLEMPAPVGSAEGPWLQTVECVNPEIVQDLASQRSATVIPLELVEVDA